MMENRRGQRVFFKCKYCKVLFDDATSLVAHKRFEHADQIFGKSPSSNNKTDWDPIRSVDEKSSAKIQTPSPPVFSPKIELKERPETLIKKIPKLPGISSNWKSEVNTRLKCRFCSKIFASTEKHREHERTHTGEKPYQCQHCLKSFTEKSATEMHEQTCPVLKILKSEVKTEEKRRPVVPKVPSKNGFKAPRLAQSPSTSVKNKPKNSTTLADSFPILKTKKVPFLPQLLKCIGSEGQVNFSCKKCDRRFKSKAVGWVHLRKHFGNKVFICPACPQQCSSMKEVVAHFQSHPASSTSSLENAVAISEYVNFFLRSAGASERNQDTIDHYTEEEDSDNQPKIFKCKHCDYKTVCRRGRGQAREFRQRMRSHIRRKHTRTNLYTCANCHRGYALKKELDNHSCNSKQKPHKGESVMVIIEGGKCPVCAMVFDTNESLAVHKNGHSKLPFLCIKCGLWFRLAQDIKGHLVGCAK